MGWLDKFIPNEVKSIAKPFQKFSKKFVPKEIRPWLPMLTPFLPMTGIMGAMGGAGGFGKMYAANLLSQAMADPDSEWDDLNQLSALLSGTQGGLMGKGTAGNLRDMTTTGKFDMSPYAGSPSGSAAGSDALAKVMGDRSFLTKTKDLGLRGLAEASEYLQGGAETLQDLGSGELDLFKLANAKEGLKAAAVPASHGMGDVAQAYAKPAIREFEKQEAADAAEIEATSTANEGERATLQMTFMRQAGHDEETIKETLAQNNLEDYYEPPVEDAAQGGIIGLKHGGMLKSKRGLVNEPGGYAGRELGDILEHGWWHPRNKPTDEQQREWELERLEREKKAKEEFVDEDVWSIKDIFERDTPLTQGLFGLDEGFTLSPITILRRWLAEKELKEKGDTADEAFNFKDGGMLNLGGNEMDYRGGGFVPIGKKERADDVPARLSKNEFVMTADAVKAAGGGSVNKGAQRMYNVMNNLEARA